MVAACRRAIPWIHGVLAVAAWRLGDVLSHRRPPAASTPARRICVIQLNALGDVLMTTPLLGALVQAPGRVGVDVVVTERTAALLAGLPGLGRLCRLRGHLAWRRPSSVLEYFRLALRLRRERYDAILDATCLLQSAWLTFLARPRLGIGPRLARRLGPYRLDGLGFLYTHEVPPPSDPHLVRQHLALLDPLGIAASSEHLRFVPSPADQDAAVRFAAERGLKDHSFAVIHPGAKWPPKQWHADRFASLVQRLKPLGLRSLVVGSAEESGLVHAVASPAGDGAVPLAGELSLGTLAALIALARVFIGNDSGLSHLAAAMDTPVVALFGPTEPDRTGPRAPGNLAVVRPIACRPCPLYFTRDRCIRGHNYCMDLLEVDAVFEAVRVILGAGQVEGEIPRG